MRVGLFAPALDIITGGTADAVKAIDPELVTVFNKRIGRFEIYDRAAPGGPRWQLVLRVQESDGSYRPLDGRALPPLMEARGRPVAELIAQIERNEDEIERQTDKRIRALGEDLYEITWALGKRVVPTVTWRERASAEAKAKRREEIRALAVA